MLELLGLDDSFPWGMAPRDVVRPQDAFVGVYDRLCNVPEPFRTQQKVHRVIRYYQATEFHRRLTRMEHR